MYQCWPNSYQGKEHVKSKFLLDNKIFKKYGIAMIQAPVQTDRQRERVMIYIKLRH